MVEQVKLGARGQRFVLVLALLQLLVIVMSHGRGYNSGRGCGCCSECGCEYKSGSGNDLSDGGREWTAISMAVAVVVGRNRLFRRLNLVSQN